MKMLKRLRLLPFTLYAVIVLVSKANSDSAEKKSFDSLLIAASKCVAAADYACARSRYVQAHLSGMSRDSLCYFMAELYITKDFFDTAFVYNFACKSTTPELLSRYTVQRQVIIDTLNNRKNNCKVVVTIPDTARSAKIQTDQSNGKRGFNYLSAFIAPAYFSYTSSPYYTLGEPLIPHFATFQKPYTSIGLSDRFIYNSKNRRVRAYQQFSFSGQLSIDQATFSCFLQEPDFSSIHRRDLIFDGFSGLFSSIIEDLKKGTRFTNSITISSDLKKTQFINLFSSLNYPVRIDDAQCYVGLTSRCLLDKNNSIADSKVGINFIGSGGPKNIFQYGPQIDLAYNWRPPIELFELKIGYTDSLVYNQIFSYYYDKECKNPSEFKTLVRKYWENLPSKPWVFMPQQNISSTVGLNGMAFLRKKWSIFGMSSVTGQIYTQRTIWYTTRNIPDMFDEADYEKFYLLYEKKSGQYYSNIRSESKTYVGGFKPAEEYNFRRIDASFFALLKLQYTGKRFNNFSISSWFGKTYSTISHKPIPTPLPDYRWGFQIEYNPTLLYF